MAAISAIARNGGKLRRKTLLPLKRVRQQDFATGNPLICLMVDSGSRIVGLRNIRAIRRNLAVQEIKAINKCRNVAIPVAKFGMRSDPAKTAAFLPVSDHQPMAG